MDAISKFWDFFDVLVDIVFTVDIFINFISAYEYADGGYEYSLKRIAINYITGFFFLDFIATFPFNLVFTAGAGGNGDGRTKPNNFLRLIRL